MQEHILGGEVPAAVVRFTYKADRTDAVATKIEEVVRYPHTLNAQEFYSNAQGLQKPIIQLNQYGFELGGPIRKNKTFFFGSWQGQRRTDYRLAAGQANRWLNLGDQARGGLHQLAVSAGRAAVLEDHIMR